MRKKAKDLQDILPGEYSDITIEALKRDRAEHLEKAEKITEIIRFFENGGKEPQPEKRKFKWNKVALESLRSIGTLSDSHTIYEMAFQIHGKEFEVDYDRRTIIARLSSAISQLRNTEVLTVHENNINTKIYGLKDWYKNNKILRDKLGKYENEIQNFGLEISDENEIF